MVKCVFCGKEQHSHMGIHVIGNDGVVRYYCSSKCRKNQEHLGRDRRKIRWTEAFHLVRDKARKRAKENEAKLRKEKEEKKRRKEEKKKLASARVAAKKKTVKVVSKKVVKKTSKKVSKK